MSVILGSTIIKKKNEFDIVITVCKTKMTNWIQSHILYKEGSPRHASVQSQAPKNEQNNKTYTKHNTAQTQILLLYPTTSVHHKTAKKQRAIKKEQIKQNRK